MYAFKLKKSKLIKYDIYDIKDKHVVICKHETSCQERERESYCA